MNEHMQSDIQNDPIPIIDLFAGPGGLGEGFSSVRNSSGNPIFSIGLSIEKDAVAHRTLSLRAMFRSFGNGKAPDSYYEYLRGDISFQQFFNSSDLRL